MDIETLLRDPQTVSRRHLLRRAGLTALALPLAGILSQQARANDLVNLKFGEMYSARTVRGLVFSDKLEAVAGRRVEMFGFMAPPLKPELDFFVLTRVALAVCPFCDDAASWPPDIVFVRLEPGKVARPVIQPIRVVGTLEVGKGVDEETGFVSLVRIQAETVELVS